MAISGPLLKTILETLHISPTELSRRAKRLDRDHGPMSGDEARWLIAHEAGIHLRRHGLTARDLDRVRELRQGMQAARTVAADKIAGGQAKSTPIPSKPVTDAPSTPAARFNARAFHPIVVQASRKLFVDGHRTEAIRKASQTVNTRVRKLSGLRKDGQPLMAEAFAYPNPRLQMTGLTTDSELDEHNGTRFLMMGAMAALRNPRSHEEHWETDSDPEFVLEALALASMLHRFLDRCEVYRAANP